LYNGKMTGSLGTENPIADSLPNPEGPICPMEVVIPDIIKNDLKDGFVRVGEKIEGFKPDLIVVLGRSGPVVFEAFRGYTEKNGLDLPPVVEANIGREVRNEFERLYPIDGSFKLSEHLDGDDGYFEWIRVNKKGLIDKIRADIDEKLKENNLQISQINKVLIIDDVKFADFDQEGETLDVAAPFIVREALKEKGNLEVKTEVLLRNTNYARYITTSSFSGLNEAERDFLRELKSGYIDTDNGLEKIEGEGELEIIGRAVEEYAGENPLEKLMKKFGISELISFPQKLREALRRVGLEYK